MLSTFIAILIVVAFTALVLLPLVPGFMELFRPTDEEPPFIRLDYTKDPRYFGRSFRSMLRNVLPDEHVLGDCKVTLSKEEILKVSNSLHVRIEEEVDQTLYVADTLTVGDGANLHNEAYSKGNIVLGRNVSVRALAGDGNIEAGAGLVVSRWIDSEGDMRLGPDGSLGISATAEGRLVLGPNTRFQRLFGNPVSLGDFVYKDWELPAPDQEALIEPEKVTNISDVCTYVRHFSTEPEQIVTGDVVSKGDVNVRELASILGSVKAHGNVVVGSGALITGNLFCEKDVVLKPGARVIGNVFSQGNVLLHSDCVIGRPGHVKSLIVRKGLSVHRGAAIYGYVLTEGMGTTEDA